jgi:hypothetical protein
MGIDPIAEPANPTKCYGRHAVALDGPNPTVRGGEAYGSEGGTQRDRHSTRGVRYRLWSF